MSPELTDTANAIWDSVADRLPNEEGGYYDPDAVVSRALGIPKWQAIAARRGYRRADRQHVYRLPRLAIQESTHAT